MATAMRIGGMVLTLAILSARTVSAQMGGMSTGGRSLGGYGAGTIASYYGNGGGGPVLSISGGKIFIPTRGGLGVMASPGRIGETPIGGVMMGGSTPIGGVSAPIGGMGRGMGSTRFMPPAYGSGAMTGMGTGMGGAPRRSPPGPGLSYPFREPPSLAGSGSMAMP